MSNYVVSYAQNREDMVLSGFFPDLKDGFYVDVGANEPVVDSVTKYFYDLGWHGINIEPLKQHYEQLLEARPRDTTLNIGVGDKKGELSLREYTSGTGLSTFSSNMKGSYTNGTNAAAVEFVDHTVAVKTLATVLEEQKVKTINFMKVDVEGFEYEVLVGNNWERFRPEVICIESNHIEKDWRPLLKEKKYELAFFDGLNNYYVDSGKPEILKRFSYVDAMIFRDPIVDQRLLPVLEEGEKNRLRVIDFEKELALKNQHINHLEAVINQITPLRRHIKRQVRGRIGKLDTKIITGLSAKTKYSPATLNSDEDLAATDARNFAAYNRSNEQPKLLSAYLSVRRMGINTALKLLRMRNI